MISAVAAIFGGFYETEAHDSPLPTLPTDRPGNDDSRPVGRRPGPAEPAAPARAIYLRDLYDVLCVLGIPTIKGKEMELENVENRICDLATLVMKWLEYCNTTGEKTATLAEDSRAILSEILDDQQWRDSEKKEIVSGWQVAEKLSKPPFDLVACPVGYVARNFTLIRGAV